MKLLYKLTAAAMPGQKYRAGSAGHPEPGSGSASTGRSGAGVANGTRYRYIGDEPLENAGSAGAGNAGAASAQAGTTATAKTRSRPNSEYVLYSNGEPVAVNADGDTSYFGTDILGSVRSVTDKYGAVKAQYEYDAFGSPYLSNDFDSGAGFGYCGKVYDSATGLYDYGFRDYAPNSARFTTVDPVRDGANWFSYVVNDPVNYIDPFGLTSTDAGNGNSPKITFSSDIIQQTYIGDTHFNFSIDVSQLGAEPSQNVTFSLVTSKPSFEFTLPTITPESFSQSSTNSDWALTQEEFDSIIANSNTEPSGWDYDSVMQAIARGENLNKQDKNGNYNQLFANEIIKYIGIPYKFGGNSDDGMDCSAPINRALTAMGFSVGRHQAKDYAADIPYIKFYNDVDNGRRADLGVINFYDLDNNSEIDHVNYGIGTTNVSPTIENPIKQIIDATDKPSVEESQKGITYMSQRNGRTSMGQYITPVDGQINQTYSPYPSKAPVKQGYIDWDYLEKNCK